MTRKKKPGIVEEMQPLMLYKYRAGIDPYAMNQDGSSKGAVVLTDKKGEVHPIDEQAYDNLRNFGEPPPFDNLPEPPRITLEEVRAKAKGYVTEEELEKLKQIPIPKGYDVLFENQYWRIIKNEGEYELMPFYATQNNGVKKAVPLGTKFDGVYGEGVLYYMRRFSPSKQT